MEKKVVPVTALSCRATYHGVRLTSLALTSAGGPTTALSNVRLVQTIAAQRGMRLAALDEVVALVDAQLQINRSAARKSA